jgi:hypothetical protein
MKNTYQPQENELQYPYFNIQSLSDREPDERKEEEEEEATMDDWGEVDPAGGPAPSAPGSAV